MNVIVDEDLCIGCGNCAEICSAVFLLNEERGKAEVLDADACEYVGCCDAAAENCPVEAITVKE